MKKEYDFSKGERGKFFRPNPKLNLPVYLDAEVLAFVQRIAKRRKTDLSSVVNQLLRGDMELVKSTQ
jgi:cytidylate kinase